MAPGEYEKMPAFVPLTYIKLTVDRPPQAALRQWRGWLAEGHSLIARFWHQRFLPRHFQTGEQRRYPIRQRSTRYLRQKERAAARGLVQDGGRTALVYSGRTRQAVEEYVRVSASGAKATARMDAPFYVTLKPKAGNSRPDMPAEITYVAPDEQQTLAAQLETYMGGKLDGFRQPEAIS